MSDPADLVASARDPDPVRALRGALLALARDLAARGIPPGQVAAMTWAGPEPAALHPSRRVVDLAYRDVFAGTRPPVRLARAEGGAVTVSAALGPAGSVPDPATAERMRDYTPRFQVPDMGALLAEWRARGERLRAGHAALDLVYGPGAAETLDLYRPPGVARPPVWVFIHGGYWQATTKEQHAAFAAGMLAAGFAVANVEYPLAPQAPLEAIATSVGEALCFLAREAEALDLDAARIHLAGHSAGAHLAALALLDADIPRPRSALLLSGLFDLEPLADLPVGRLLGLDDPARVAALSPIRRPAPTGARVALALGGRESAAFLAQSRGLAAAWGLPAPLVIPDANHFDLLEGLLGGALLDLARETAA